MASLAAAALAGCLSYSGAQLSAMSTYDICELQSEQWRNLNEESRRAARSELERRKADCATYASAIQARRQFNLHEQMYNNQSP